MKISKDIWEQIVWDSNLEEDDFRTDYSGRYMYGKSCIGVVGNAKDLLSFILTAQQHLDDDVIYDLAGAMRQDNMGLSMIYYFPGWTVADDILPDGDTVAEDND